MGYVVRFTDEKSGAIKLKYYDFKNDALEFMKIHKDKGLFCELYVREK